MGDTDRNEIETNDKFNMKVQFDSYTRTDKNRQCITGGIFYCRDSADFSVSASKRFADNLTAVLRNRQQKHTVNRFPSV